ncbi:MAG: CDP-alcohol phosphatidyltransferase family protein [Candidatus Saccharimonadaceae bacterium]|nr:CDP-alcohol phosphatidyltransferase family protein [Candidatus Saccharimonadaceae bacterium]
MTGQLREFWQDFKVEWKVWPNLITLVRFCLFWLPVPYMLDHRYLIASIIFSIIALLDTADGLIARHCHLETKTGARLDPIADTCFLTTNIITLIFLTPSFLIGFPFIVIVCREVFVGCANLISKFKYKTEVKPSLGGKFKMWPISIAIILQFIHLMGYCREDIVIAASWFAAGVAVTSGVDYFDRLIKMRNKKILR